jgi:hypothetical protein
MALSGRFVKCLYDVFIVHSVAIIAVWHAGDSVLESVS